MASGFIPIDHYRTKLYQRRNDSNNFLKLSEDELAHVAQKVYKRQEMLSDTLSYKLKPMSKLEIYYDALRYLTSPLIHLELPTYDEKIAYLIMTVDPYLVLFKEFLKIDLPGLDAIFKIEDKKERNRLLELRNQTIAIYETTVREQIGFFDINLLKFEEMFFKKYYGERELITEVQNNNQDYFINNAKILRSFNNISNERYNDLVQVAQTWLSIAPNEFNSKVATYSVTNQRKLLGLRNLAEQAALFILLVDSNLDMLRIYEEESRMPNVEKRIIEEFGYYNPELLNLEKKFHKRFCPEKELSIWTKVKKD